MGGVGYFFFFGFFILGLAIFGFSDFFFGWRGIGVYNGYGKRWVVEDFYNL